MGEPTLHTPVLPILAAFSRYDEALAWARRRFAQMWGPVGLESEPFAFDQTDYYAATMGPGLRKVFLAAAEPVDPSGLVDWKLATNAWEAEYAAGVSAAPGGEPRPLNLDPGYLTLGKLVLASTKDFAHRVYLGRGIYAEITLFYRRHRWEHHEWTFADYRQPGYHEFFTRCRDYLHRRLREGASP